MRNCARFYAYAPNTAKRIPRIPLGNNKGAQLNVAMLDLIPEYGLLPFDLGRVLAGYVEDCRWISGRRESKR